MYLLMKSIPPHGPFELANITRASLVKAYATMAEAEKALEEGMFVHPYLIDTAGLENKLSELEWWEEDTGVSRGVQVRPSKFKARAISDGIIGHGEGVSDTQAIQKALWELRAILNYDR